MAKLTRDELYSKIEAFVQKDLAESNPILKAKIITAEEMKNYPFFQKPRLRYDENGKEIRSAMEQKDSVVITFDYDQEEHLFSTLGLAQFDDITEDTELDKLFEKLRDVLKPLRIADPIRTLLLEDYEKCRNYLIVRPINVRTNRGYINRAIYQRIEDIALVLYIQFGHREGTLLTSKIDKHYQNLWKTDTQQLLLQTLENTMRLYPPILFQGFIEKTDYNTLETGLFMDRDFAVDEDGPGTFSLTALPETNGATAIFYPGVMERIADILQSDFYFGMLGVEMVIIHPVYTVDPFEMSRSIRENNRVFSNDALSNTIFLYEKEKHTFKTAVK